MSRNAVVEIKSFNRKFGIILAPVISCITVVNDVLIPLAPFGLYLSIALAIAAVVVLISFPVFEKIAANTNIEWDETVRTNLRKNSRQIGVILILLGLLVSAAYIYGSNMVNSEGKPVGILASKVPTIQGWQESLGLIEEELKVISETLTSVDQGVKDVHTDTTALRQDSSVMRRQAATNIGMVYMAMTSGDLPALQEAAEQGFNFANIHNPMGPGTSITYFTSVLGSNYATIADVLEFLHQNKALEPKAPYVMRGSFPPAVSSEVQSYMSAAITTPALNNSENDAEIAELKRQNDKLNGKLDQARACEMESRTHLHELTSEILDQNHAEVDAHNESVAKVDTSKLLEEYNRRKRAEFEATQATKVKEWEALAEKARQAAKQIFNEEGSSQALLDLKLLEQSIAFGSPNEKFDLPRKPSFQPAFILPSSEGPQTRQYILYTEASELAKAQLAQKTVCDNQQELRSQISQINQEIRFAQSEKRNMPAPRTTIPQVIRTDSSFMMEAAFSGNTRAVEWFRGKGINPAPARIHFNDGHILQINPKNYL